MSKKTIFVTTQNIWILFIGFIIGYLAAQRPILSWHKNSGIKMPPLNPIIWQSKTQQFELLDQWDLQEKIVYLGDSISDWGEISEALRFQEGLVLNRGISGDTTVGILNRLDSSFPSNVIVCVLLIGYNDLHSGASPKATVRRINEICDHLISEHKVSHVIVETIPHGTERTTKELSQFNSLVREQDYGERTVVFDLERAMKESGSESDYEAFFVDALHLSGLGFQERLKQELNFIEEHMPFLRNQLVLVSENKE